MKRKILIGIALAAGLLLVLAASGSHLPSMDGRDALAGTTSAAPDEGVQQETAPPHPIEDDRPPRSTRVPVGAEGAEVITEESNGASMPDTGLSERPVGTADVQIVTEDPSFTPPPPATRESRSSGEEDQCGWQLTFEDNFDEESLDANRWNTNYKAGMVEAQYYVPDVFELDDGILKIPAEERQVGDRQYASGIITTQGTFEQHYGRFEARVKAPAGKGLWPAFWLMPSSQKWPPEIDVFEFLGHEPDTVYMTNHWRDENGERVYETYGFKGPDFSQDFHTFEAIWTPDKIVWLVDGVERARETRGIPDEPMFMLLNLAVGGEWPGYPDETTPFPSYLEVDYVRAYEWTCPEDSKDDAQSE